MDDDTNLFELTEKSNNTYMALSYWNRHDNGGTHRYGSSRIPNHAITQVSTPMETQRDVYRQNAMHEEPTESTPTHLGLKKQVQHQQHLALEEE